MNRSYPILAALSLTAAFLVGCSRSVQIENISAAETIVLEAESEYPSSIRISGRGKIEGAAKISLMVDGKAYRTEELSGKVDFEWFNDWYSEEAVLKYKPGTVKSGNLTLKYRF